MAGFEVRVCRLEEVTPHPNADLLDIGRVAGYRFIIGKGHEAGELGAYIPEAAILPDTLIEEMSLTGRLAGKAKNRVKAIRLRGELSQGLWYPLATNGLRLDIALDEGEDASGWLGIEKYEPPIPIQLQGRVRAVGPERPFWCDYDLENIKTFPDILHEGELVSVTEKLHGTLLFCGLLGGELIVTSKGLAKRRLAIEEDAGNTYWRAVRAYHLEEKLREYVRLVDIRESVILFGEILGPQDLKYDLANGQIAFHAFDLFDNQVGFLAAKDFRGTCDDLGIPTVPQLYSGPFSWDMLHEHTSGKSSLASHIREGVVVKPLTERSDPKIGRVALKSISPDYLLRGGNTTEFN